jgi:hypothetical protein
MKETKNISKVPPKKRDKIKEAEMDYRKMWEEIKPFIKKREVKRYSTAGQWKASSCDLQE